MNRQLISELSELIVLSYENAHANNMNSLMGPVIWNNSESEERENELIDRHFTFYSEYMNDRGCVIGFDPGGETTPGHLIYDRMEGFRPEWRIAAKLADVILEQRYPELKYLQSYSDELPF